MTPLIRARSRTGSGALADVEAFAALYRAQAEAIVAFFARRTFDPEAAADLTAETFAQAFASRGRYRERGDGATGWLFGIAQHQLFRYYRSGRIEVRARERLAMPLTVDLSDGDYERIEDLIDFETRSDAVRDAMAKLTRAERDALRARVIESQPYREVASHLGCSEQAARVRVARGLRHLEALLAT
jgi:RNA polymerase sigma factor (sigma-70 family)